MLEFRGRGWGMVNLGGVGDTSVCNMIYVEHLPSFHPWHYHHPPVDFLEVM